MSSSHIANNDSSGLIVTVPLSIELLVPLVWLHWDLAPFDTSLVVDVAQADLDLGFPDSQIASLDLGFPDQQTVPGLSCLWMEKSALAVVLSVQDCQNSVAHDMVVALGCHLNKDVQTNRCQMNGVQEGCSLHVPQLQVDDTALVSGVKELERVPSSLSTNFFSRAILHGRDSGMANKLP